jgi:hypothetical protein
MSAPGRKNRVTSSVVSTNAKARHAGEVLAQRLGEHQREVAEAGHRAADVAQHHQLRLVDLPRPVMGDDGDAPGAERGPHGLAEVQPALTAEPTAGGQPDRQPPGQRGDGAAQLGQVARLRAQEVHLVGQRTDRVLRDLVPPLLRGRPPAHLRLDRGPERGQPLLHRLPCHLLGQTAAVPLAQQAGQQLGDQGVRRQGPEHPVAEERLTGRRGLPAAQPVDRGPREAAQRLLVAVP